MRACARSRRRLRGERARGRSATDAARAGAAAGARIPRATYRVQLHRGLHVRATRPRSCPISRALGISHVYCSPYLRARPGSTHGYDIVDHDALNPEIGTREDFDALRRRRCARTAWARCCDIVPEPHGRAGRGQRVVARRARERPGVGATRTSSTSTGSRDAGARAARCCCRCSATTTARCSRRASSRSSSSRRAASFAVRYYEHRFPLDPRELSAHPRRAVARPARARHAPPTQSPSSSASRTAFAAPAGARRRGPGRAERGARLHKRSCEAAPRGACATLARRRAAHRAQRCARSTARPAIRRASTRCTRCSRRRPIRLAYWRVAADEINYRRFFDINDLAALRMENEAVFEATHALRARAGRSDGTVDGLRIDHPDGLFDPAQYFARLQAALRAAGREARPATPSRARSTSWSRRSSRRTSACPRRGRCTAPPATASRTSSTASSSTRGARRASTASTRASSATSRTTSSEVALRRASALIMRRRARVAS